MSSPIYGCITAFDEDPMSAALIEPYRVLAFNTAHDSENKIHDDATARRFGFGGGLVPGVDVYGYMTHLPVMRWAAPGWNVAPRSAASSNPSMTAKPRTSPRQKAMAASTSR